LIESVPIATRSGQVVLYQLTEAGRAVSESLGLAPGSRPRASLEHLYWARQATGYFEQRGYQVSLEHSVPADGTVDLLAERPGERVAVEIETGKSNIRANLEKLSKANMDRVVFVATSPAAVTACQRILDRHEPDATPRVELLTWLDIS
jgi:hypothetical protein